jgi:hypothetical protein
MFDDCSMYILWQPFVAQKSPWARALVRNTSAMVVMYIIPLGQSVPQCFKFKVNDTLTSIYPQLASDTSFNRVEQSVPGRGDTVQYCGVPMKLGATLRSVFLHKAVKGSMCQRLRLTRDLRLQRIAASTLTRRRQRRPKALRQGQRRRLTRDLPLPQIAALARTSRR